MRLFCSHKYGEVKDGYQYCEKCGKAIPVAPMACSHHWVNESSWNVKAPRGNVYKVIHLDRCDKCGAINRYEVV